jgi:hypothetical protein
MVSEETQKVPRIRCLYSTQAKVTCIGGSERGPGAKAVEALGEDIEVLTLRQTCSGPLCDWLETWRSS